MAPKRKSLKRKAKGRGGMNLRSGTISGRQARLEDGSPRVLPVRSPTRQGRKTRMCPFVDDEASVDDESSVDDETRVRDEDSNFIDDEAIAITENVTLHTDNIEATFEEERHDESHGQDPGDTNMKHSRFFGQEVSLGLISDVMSKFYVLGSTEPPPVPLCRLLPTDAVRVAESDATWLIPLFDTAGYVKTMGSFIVSVKGRHGETKLVTDKDIDKWDPIWQELNEEFEAQLTEEWVDLRGKFFHVYDGNNRVKTWDKRIKDKHSESRLHHAQVKCQFIEFEPKKEGELLLSLDTTNAISRATATPNLGHEIFMFQKFGLANKESIMECLTMEQRTWMETELKFEVRHNQGMVPWYSTPCILISQLVWKGKWIKFLNDEDGKLRNCGLMGDEFKKKMDASIKREQERFRDSGYKYLSIANPIHGEEFFSIIFNRDWDDKTIVGITRDKLYSLCSAKISSERRKELLHMMTLTKVKDPKASYFADYKKMRFYMKQEAYWHGMFNEANILIEKFEVEGPPMPKTFEAFYKMSRKLHVINAFSQLFVSMKSASDIVSLPDVMYSSKRLIYRWLCDCIKQNTISEMPIDTIEWMDLSDKNTMFSPALVERGLTLWECSNCPWWIEYPLGIVPKQELQLHATFVKDNPTTVRPLPILPCSDHGEVQGIQSTTKKSSKRSKTVDVDNESLDESDVTPLIRKKDKNPATATSSRSRASQSILERPTTERRPLQRKFGREFGTCVDALLVDVADIDDFARLSIREWFENSRTLLSQMEYHRQGVCSSIVARLIFADFPTSMLVHGLHIPLQGVDINIPDWNVFDVSLGMGVMEIAHTHLADEGFLVTLCLAQDFGSILRCAQKHALQLHRSWTLDIDGGYVHPQTQEQVTDVTSGLFHRKNMPIPSYDRLAGQEVSPQLFPASRSCITEGQLRAFGDFLSVDGILVRGGAERSKTFFRWLLATFTQQEDYVIDVFAGCGGLGVACSQDLRHCLMLELDAFVFYECLEKIVCGPSRKGGD